MFLAYKLQKLFYRSAKPERIAQNMKLKLNLNGTLIKAQKVKKAI